MCVCIFQCISGFQLKQGFVDKSRHLYDSEPVVLESLQQVNDWVYNATNGKMPEFLSSLPPNLIVMLINAVHFKGTAFLQVDPQRRCAGVKVFARVFLIKFSLSLKRRMGSSIWPTLHLQGCVLPRRQKHDWCGSHGRCQTPSEFIYWQ